MCLFFSNNVLFFCLIDKEKKRNWMELGRWKGREKSGRNWGETLRWLYYKTNYFSIKSKGFCLRSHVLKDCWFMCIFSIVWIYIWLFKVHSSTLKMSLVLLDSFICFINYDHINEISLSPSCYVCLKSDNGSDGWIYMVETARARNILKPILYNE